MIALRALIQEARILAPGYYGLWLNAPEIAAAAIPGQFMQVRVGDGETTDPLLPRPISFYRIDRETGTIALLFKAVGKGTRILAGKRTGELLSIYGPLGNGFQIPADRKRIALIAGGIGMPPLYCLAADLRLRRPDLEMVLFYGGRGRRDLLELDQWERLGVEVVAATGDGSFGAKGLVTAAFEERHWHQPYDYLVACGPNPMLMAVQRLAAAEGIPGLLSLEAYMACGVGACLGCSCRTNRGYRRVCVDGPVFSMGEVTLE